MANTFTQLHIHIVFSVRHRNGGSFRRPRFQIQCLKSSQREVRCRLAAITACFDVERYGLAVVQLADACALKRRNVHEHITVAICRGNKTKTLGCVKPFHGAIGHRVYSIIFAIRETAMTRLCV